MNNRFPNLIKMAMARYGIRESDIRQALLALPHIDGNPANFLALYHKYGPQLKAVKQVFGTSMVLTEEDEAKISKLEDLRKLFTTFGAMGDDKAFSTLVADLFDRDQENGFARVSVTIKDIWSMMPEREGDIKAFITALRKNFGFTLYDFPFTIFAKKFKAVMPSDTILVPMWSALVDVRAKLGAHNPFQSPGLDAQYGNLLREFGMWHDGDENKLVDALGFFYHAMVERLNNDDKEGAGRIKVFITTVMNGIKLKYQSIPNLSKYPALEEFLKTGSLSGAVNRQTKALLIKVLTTVKQCITEMGITNNFMVLENATLNLIKSVDAIIKKAGKNEQVLDYVNSMVMSTFTRATPNKQHWMFIYLENADDHPWLREMLTKRGVIRDEKGVKLIRKWGSYVGSKMGTSPAAAVIRYNLSALAQGGYPSNIPDVLDAMLSLPKVGERMAVEYLRALDRDAATLLHAIRGTRRGERYEVLEQLVMKAVGK